MSLFLLRHCLVCVDRAMALFNTEYLMVRAALRPRNGWAEACIEMAKDGDDELLDGAVATEWDETEA